MRKFKWNRVVFPVFVILLFLLMTWVVVNNYTKINELEGQGRQPVTTIATPLVGERGERGLQGEQGEQGLQGERGVQGLRGDRGERGVQGEQGIQGIQGIQGVTGTKGADGANGSNGTNGRNPELACVIRWDDTLPTVTRYFVAWKYTDEPSNEATWRNLYRINSQDRLPSGCIDLRTTP